LLLRVNRDGSRTTSFLFADPPSRPAPFDPTGEAYLLLFGTGMRGSRSEAAATIGATSIPIAGIAAQSEFPGLDQINLGPVPESLATKLGEQELRITIDGVSANTVTIAPSRPAIGEWASRARLLLANSEMSVAETGGKIYVIGGYPSTRITVDEVQVYDTASDTWSLAPKLPAPVNHSMPAAVNGRIYIAGGQSDAGNASFVATMYEFDPATQLWRTRAPMPRPRGGGAAAVLDGKIYVAGGRPPGGAEFAVYDPATDRWTELPPIPTQRNHLGVVAVGGKIYVVGGRVEAGFQSRVLDTVEVFDPRTNSWSNAAPLPRPRGGLNAIEANGCIHVFGGEGNSTAPNGVFPDHDVYNPRTNAWTHLSDLPIPVHGVTGLAFVSGLIYLPGGGTAQGGSSGGTQHQVYRPAQDCRN
jgi:N-acetylneuraminic acid mutarotase